MGDQLEPLKKIGEALRSVAAELGLDQKAFVVMPNFEGGPDVVQVIFELDVTHVPSAPTPDDGVEVSEDQPDIDAAFAEMMRGEAKAAEQARMDEIATHAAQLRDRLANPDRGILE